MTAPALVAAAAAPQPLDDATLWNVLTPLATDQWPIDKLMPLVRLWEAGTSVPAIEDRLRLSKNSIIGRIRRLAERGIVAHRPNPAREIPGASETRQRELSQERARRVKARMDVPTRPQPKPAPVVAPVPSYVPPYLGRVVDCCWPIGRPGTPDFHFCDKPSEPGKPYCHRHVQVAYQKARPADVLTQISVPGRMAHVGRGPSR